MVNLHKFSTCTFIYNPRNLNHKSIWFINPDQAQSAKLELMREFAQKGVVELNQL